MIFHETEIDGVWLIEPERFADDRGFFARTFCQREFADHGIEVGFPQANVSYNEKAGTLRGLHFQWPPHEEGKLVRCSRGEIFDVVVDLRPNSSSFGAAISANLSAGNGRQLFAPKGVAHGFLTLAGHSEVSYLMSSVFVPGAGAGYRYDDRAFDIHWPAPPEVIAQKDLDLPTFDSQLHKAQWMEKSNG